MKKHVILAAAAALVLGAVSAVMADEQKTAAPAVTEAAKPAQTAEATKPAPTTTEAAKPAATTEAAATKPTTTGSTTAGTQTKPTTASTTHATQNKQEVRFKVTGPTGREGFDTLRSNLARANGVFNVNCDHLTGNCTAQVDPAKTSADKITSWVKTNYPNYNCMVQK